MSIVTILRTPRGSEQAVDKNGIYYYFGHKTTTAKYWVCAQKGCSVRMITRISTSELVGDTWPVHDHGTNLLKRKAKEAESLMIKKYAEIPSTTAKMVLSDVTNQLLASSQPSALYGMSSGGAIKIAFWREKKKVKLLLHIIILLYNKKHKRRLKKSAFFSQQIFVSF
jgi:hypothetical protein